MHVQIEQEHLVEALRTTVRAAATKHTIPVLTGILLQAADSQLQLRATDLEVSVAQRIPAGVRAAGAVVLPARYLYELVRRLPPGGIDLTVDPLSLAAHLRTIDTDLTLGGLPAEQFPAPPAARGDEAVTLAPRQLQTLLRETGFAIASDETRPWFTGVFCSVAGSAARAIATDGAVLAYAETPVSNPLGLDFSVIIPGRTAQELARVAGEARAERCVLHPIHNQLLCELGDTQVGTRLLEGQYPDVFRVLPAAFPSTAQVDVERLAAACDRAGLVSRDGSVRLEGGADGLQLSACSNEVGRVGERVPAIVSGPDFVVGLNVKFVLEGLRMMGAGPVLLEFAGQRCPVRFRRGPGSTSFFAVMPLISF